MTITILNPESLKYGVGCSLNRVLALYYQQLALSLVVLNEGLGLLVVDFKTILNGVGLVVLALDKVALVIVSNSVNLRL